MDNHFRLSESQFARLSRCHQPTPMASHVWTAGGSSQGSSMCCRADVGGAIRRPVIGPVHTTTSPGRDQRHGPLALEET